MNLSNVSQDTLMKAVSVALIAGYVVALVGIIVLAVVHDGQLADQAMQTLTQIAVTTAGAGGILGAAHTIASNLMGSRGAFATPVVTPPAVASAPTPQDSGALPPTD